MQKTNKQVNTKFIDFERGFLRKTSFVAVFISFIGLIINFALDFGTVLYIIPTIAIVVYGLFYYYAGLDKNIVLVKWLFAIVTIIFLNLLWVFNYGSNGPAPYFFILIYSLLIFIFSNKQLGIISAIIVINILVFFFLDIYFPGITNNYNSEFGRIVDVYTGLIFYSIIVFVLIKNAKVNFVREYHKAKISDNVKINFLHNISHEIRTPLNAIVGFSTLMCNDDLDQKDKDEYFKAIEESNQTLLKLINEIIDASQIEAESIELFPQNFDIKSILNEIHTKNKKILVEKEKSHIDFQVLLPKEKANINFDKERFKQIFSLLLDNAIKFTDTGIIELGCKIKSSEYLFWVSDTGIGIKDEFKDKVFNSFLKNEKYNSGLYRGTGIGLFLAKALIDMNEGKIWLESIYGKGTTIYFSFPKPSKYKRLLSY